MRFELDRSFFRQLIWLDLTSGLAVLVAFAPTLFAGRWFEFDQAFNSLVDEKFGNRTLAPLVEDVLMIGLGAACLWMIASVVGLFWFKRWARLGFWLAPLIGSTLLMLVYGFRPTFSSPMDEMLAFLNSAVFGAIVLLSYANGLGSEWFEHRIAATKD